MKGRTVVLDEISGRKAAALVVDGQLDDLLVDGPEDVPTPGSILRAMVGRPLKGQGGVMLTLPDGDTAFLRQTRGLSPGSALLVQVTGYAFEGKAVPVTTRLIFKGSYAIVTPDAPGLNVSRQIKDDETRDALMLLASEAELPEGAGLILRSASAGADEDDVLEEIRAMAALSQAVLDDAEGRQAELLVAGDDAHALAMRDWSADAFDDAPEAFARHGVTEMIDALREPVVALPGGASLVIEPTRALVAVDVNTGPDGSPAAGLKANIAAARALPRQLRCRGLGGQITVDFAPAPKKDRRQIEASLKSSFRQDAVDTVLAGWTPLGHFELQRKRERLPLSETLP